MLASLDRPTVKVYSESFAQLYRQIDGRINIDIALDSVS
jgi:hypothetical protein